MSMNVVGEATVRATIELDEKSTKSTVDQAAKGIETGLRSVGRNISSAGRAMTLGLTVPLVTAGANVIKFASEFEREMIRVQIATDGTADQMAALNDLARELGASTVFSAAEAAEGMSALGRAGFSTEEILSSIRGTLALAATEQMDLSRASEITAAALRGMGLDAGQAGRVADVLAQGANDSLASVEGLGNALGYTAGQARLQGLSLEQTVGFLAALSDAGIDASRSGTALNQMLRNLSAPTKKLGTQLTKFGVKVRDSSGQMRNMEDIFRDVSKLGPDAMNSIARAMDANASRAFLELAQRAGQSDNNLSDLVDRLQGAEGAAQRMGNALTGGTAGALEQLSSAVEGLSISIAQSGLLQVFTDIIRGVTDMIDEISKADPQLLRVITIFGLVAAAIGPALVAIGAVVSAIGTIGAAISAIGGASVLGPILLVIAALVGIGLAFKAAYDNSQGFRDVLAAIGTQLVAFGQGFVDGFLKGIQPLVDIFNSEIQPVLQDFGTELDKLLQAAAPIMEKMAPMFQMIGDVIGQAFGASVIAPIMGFIAVIKAIAFVSQQAAVLTVQAIQGIQAAWGAVVGAVTGAWDSIVGAVQSGIDAVVNFVTGSGKTISDAGTSAWDTFVKGVQDALQGLADWVSSVWLAFWNSLPGQVLANFLGLIGDLIKLSMAIGNYLISFFAELGKVIITQLQGWWGSVSGFFEGVWAAIAGPLEAFWAQFTGLWLQGLKVTADTVTAWGNNIKNFFQGIWNAIVTTTTAWGNNIINAVSVPLRAIGGAISTALAYWGKIFGDLQRTLTDAMRRALESVGNAISGSWDYLGRKLNGIKDQIVTFWSGAGTWLYNAGKMVIEGFLNGLNSMISEIRKVLQGITDMIPKNKGPVSRDRVLLVKNGQLIMESLLSGIDRGVPELQRKLRGITNMVPSGVGAGSSGSTTAAVGAGATATEAVTINQIFNGPTTSGGRLREIDWTLRYATKARGYAQAGVAT